MDNVKMQMQYIGVLSLLCRLSRQVEDEEDRQCIEQALADAKEVMPNLKWKRNGRSYIIEFE